MPITYEIRGDHVFERWLDVITADEVRAHFLALLNDPIALRIRRSLVDVRLTEATFRGSDISLLVHTIMRPALEGTPWRSGVVARSALEIGLARQLTLLAAGVLVLRTFEDEESALAWMLSSAD